jgi:DNA-binding PadR family transcriptional regulator
MHLLASGPCALDSGPVGRCSSRGWIRCVEFDEIGRGVYELTASGRAHIEENWVTVVNERSN